ncbi:PucR family transcriptional regulator [Nocardia cerradoensis]|uniref:PucR family transcriptional regulator n=1 Tax=Nocardia cerradoensis TaxID=85688 RepID=UPI0002F03D23|nr:PucR family transcriptional regulator [Nocardia cerradoensis]NKY42186.1 PucR family transcriptional regulator [Nocardia cerradoensis]
MDEPGAEAPRLRELGADPAAVLRLIRYFDGFDESDSNADTVVRAAALLAECPAAASWPSGTVIRYDAAGRPLPAVMPPPEATGEPAVWLERTGAAHALDAVLVDRLRHCLRVVAVRGSAAAPTGLDDPALLEVVLSEKQRREDRVRAMRLLGIDPAQPTRVLAVSGPGAAEAVRIIGARGRVVRSAVIGATTAVLIQDRETCRELSDVLNSAVVQEFPASRRGAGGPWVGMGERLPAYAAATSWEQARRALRFASSTWHGRRVVAYERLGSLALLGELPVQRLLGTSDVLRVNAFAATEAGALAVDTLEAFCVFGSLRRTAAELHLHHSTVAARIAQVEAVMGWDVDEALDRFMATLALMVRRIALSSAELAADPGAAGRADPTDVG